MLFEGVTVQQLFDRSPLAAHFVRAKYTHNTSWHRLTNSQIKIATQNPPVLENINPHGFLWLNLGLFSYV